MHTILICDDERDIVSALKIYLEAAGYAAICTYSGQEALDALERDPEIRLVLLDIMMPELDGHAALRQIRERSNVPVIFLTAKGEDTDKILGLDLGADDYVTKPFNPVELLARVRSQLRRYLQLGGGTQTEGALAVGGIRLNDERKEVTLDGEPVSMTPTEFEILRLLMLSPGRVFRPDAIYRAVWREEPFGAESTVAVHIRHIREKIEITPNEPRYVKVVFGQGYKIEKER